MRTGHSFHARELHTAGLLVWIRKPNDRQPSRRKALAIALLMVVLASFQIGTCLARIVCIDPGHQEHANNDLEPIGPGSSTMKAKVSAGTSGAIAGPEYVVVLDIGLKLRDLLVDAGTSVVMTRTTNDVDISNSERAQIANACNADLFIRLHCNSGGGPGGNGGCFTLYPAYHAGWTDDIYDESLRAAQIVQQIYAQDTGLPDLGLTPRSDLTGFNWSDVPVILPEMLHMGNSTEDALVATDAFRQTMAEALKRGIIEYLNSITRIADWQLY
jgi:N-acetylmuramoyl-L-alanine amidase